MPCYEPTYIHSKGDAILCSLFHRADDQGVLGELIDSLDYALIGLTKDQVIAWWKEHKGLDAKRLKEKR